MKSAVNRQKELIERLENDKKRGLTPRILLHACCAPCSSTCLEVLDEYADITVFFYNPNITVKSEYEYRLSELNRLIGEMPFRHRVDLKEGDYEPEAFLEMAKGLEKEPERGARCVSCYGMRILKTAELAIAEGYDYYLTTLTLSPLKPADVINSIGLDISERLNGRQGSIYLPSDFKKNNGYLRSIELSKEYGLYRQNYCGCTFSRKEPCDA